jgi:NADPH:quinone reductase-like Zn-dependent oxidoreductase
MRTVTYDHFGGPEVLTLTEAPAPPARPGHLLVRVAAVSINPLDAKIRRGGLRLLSGGHFPKTPGLDFSGTVEQVGAGVTGFAISDAVFGFTGSMRTGTLAEVIAVPAAVVAHRPASLDHVAAAAIAVTGLAALQLVRDHARVKPGDRVLVNGASGGVGPYAIQLARRAGAHVTAVATGDGLGLARSLGADEVVDYRAASVAASGRRFDAVLDLSTRLPFAAARPILAPRGVHVAVEPSPPALLAAAVSNLFRARKRRLLITRPRPADLASLARSLAAGELHLGPVRELDLAAVREAFTAVEAGGLVGKAVLRLR